VACLLIYMFGGLKFYSLAFGERRHILCITSLLGFLCLAGLFILQFGFLVDCRNVLVKDYVRDVSICDLQAWQATGEDFGRLAYFRDGSLLGDRVMARSFAFELKKCTGKYLKDSCTFYLAPLFAHENSSFVCAWAINLNSAPKAPDCGGEGRGGLCGRETSYRNLTGETLVSQGTKEAPDKIQGAIQARSRHPGHPNQSRKTGSP